MDDNMLGFARTLSKIGGSIMICVVFVALVLVLSENGVAVTNWMVLLGLVVLALLIRLYVARVDRSYDKEEDKRRTGR